jgi:hypothetical protein
MKSERRHELQHNVLADWLAQTAESLKPYQNMVMFGTVLILIVLAVGIYWSKQSAASATRAWDEFNTALVSANPATALSKVIEDLPGTTAAEMAAVVSADRHLAEGCRDLFVNKATAQNELSKAIDLYAPVRERSQVSSLREAATFGLARAREAKGDATNIEQAVKLYEELSKNWPNGAYTPIANERLADLKKPATKELYDRFAHFDPKPVFSTEPAGRLPFDSGSIPRETPLPGIEPLPGLNPEGPAKDQEKAETKKPSEGTNAAEPAPLAKPETPADTSKPAEGTKAPEKSGE